MPNTREKLIELLSIGHECPDGRNPFLEESCSTCPYGKAKNCGAEMQADHLIANGVTVQEWIPVTERLPEENTAVLTYRESGINVEFRWHRGWDNDEFTPFPVTHWMPLPEPPKEV